MVQHWRKAHTFLQTCIKAVHVALKLMHNKMEISNYRNSRFLGGKFFWLIKNRNINAINTLNARNKASSVLTLDFLAPYIIGRYYMLSIIYKMTDFCFDGREKQYIPVKKSSAFWMDHKNRCSSKIS